MAVPPSIGLLKASEANGSSSSPREFSWDDGNVRPLVMGPASSFIPRHSVSPDEPATGMSRHATVRRSVRVASHEETAWNCTRFESRSLTT